MGSSTPATPSQRSHPIRILVQVSLLHFHENAYDIFRCPLRVVLPVFPMAHDPTRTGVDPIPSV
jgi:hypothetical protein